MEEWKKRGRIWKGFLLFLMFMGICTLISKSIYVSKLPRVSTVSAEKKSIEHVVKATGTIKQGRDAAIHTKSGLRVAEIYVRVGDKIEEGSSLFRLDQEDLEDNIEKKTLEIEKLQLRIQELEENENLEESKQQRSVKRAGEDGAGTQEKADTAVERAEQAEGQAEADLEQYLQEGVSLTPEEERQKRREAYQSYLHQVEEKQKAAGEKETLLTSMEEAAAAAEQKLKEAEGKETAALEAVQQAQEKLSNAQTPEEQEAAQAELDAAMQLSGQAQAERETAAGEHEAVMQQLETANQEYALMKSELEQLISQPVTEPDFSGEDSARKSWEAEKKGKEEQKKQAQYDMEDALKEQEEAKQQAKRKLEDAADPQKADSTLSITRLELKQLKKELEEYRSIEKEDGMISASFSGTVTKLLITTGEKTTDGAAVVCADPSVPYQLEMMLDQKQKNYVEQGDEVTVKAGKVKKELQVDFMSENENNPGTYRAIIYLPEGMGGLGMNGEVVRRNTSERYSCCVPIEALKKENQQYYVYLLAERHGILGKERYVSKKNVEVLDQNDQYAALAEGSLTEKDQVITDSDKELKIEQIVRLKSEIMQE